VRYALLIALGACGTSSTGTPRTPEVANTSSSAGAGALALRVEGTSGHALIVDNQSDRPVSLQREIVVEHDAGGRWERVDASGLYLRDRCDVQSGALYEPPPCVEIAAHTTFRAEPWTDEIGDSQCMCEECGPVPAGNYRMAVVGCDGGHRVETAPFPVSGR
jgi:hypothetical protein